MRLGGIKKPLGSIQTVTSNVIGQFGQIFSGLRRLGDSSWHREALTGEFMPCVSRDGRRPHDEFLPNLRRSSESIHRSAAP